MSELAELQKMTLMVDACDLENALHEMAQPLTALVCLIDLSQGESGGMVAGEDLQIAVIECRRALTAFSKVRAVVGNGVKTK